jgi:hypothetical protein
MTIKLDDVSRTTMAKKNKPITKPIHSQHNITSTKKKLSLSSPPSTTFQTTRQFLQAKALLSLCHKIPSILSPFCSSDDLRVKLTKSGSDPRGVIIMLLQTPNNNNLHQIYYDLHSLLLQLDRYYPYPVDIMILHENLSTTDKEIFTSFTLRNIIWVDVSQYFITSKSETQIPWNYCARNTRMGYRKMCQLMSSQLYWMPELDSYQYIIRFDDDSEILGNIPFNFFDMMDQYQLNYAYALEIRDNPECQTGFIDTIHHYVERNHIKPVRFGPVSFYPSTNLDNIGGDTWNATSRVFNCNFEVVRLDTFRSQAYRNYMAEIESSQLIFTTRLGDHAIKTVYLELFIEENKIACLTNFPYGHGHGQGHRKTTCKHYGLNVVVMMN